MHLTTKQLTTEYLKLAKILKAQDERIKSLEKNNKVLHDHLHNSEINGDTIIKIVEELINAQK